ncbi:MarR family winged helix-turn-helix transcriptional regulator [Floridanema evergladense]|uniref:MarR family winged helix-turn-helix transcriptional regulator n=1 Tax=Floridaenema evergladense BLCC-F167 TaxID=3153639 RepID=A0ABV4WRK9_9CYAN
MGKKQHNRKITSEKCAARVMETIPLAMRFIRADIRSRNSTTMSVPQFRTLAFLDRNPGASLSDLAEHLGVTRATASANTERLVQRDFVYRRDDPKERRRVVLNLTEAGKVHLEECRSQTRDRISELLNSLTEQQILLIEEGLTLLKDVLEENSLELPEE